MSLNALAATLTSSAILIPRLRAFVERQARLEAAGKRERKSAVIRDAKLTIEAFKNRIAEFNHGDDFDDEELFHPSRLGSCERALWLDHFHAPRDGASAKSDELRSHFVFEIGTYFHVAFQNLCARAGILKKREPAIHNALKKILGHADGVVELDGVRYVLEIKTINGRNFTLLGADPKYEHLLQTTAYMDALNIRRAIIIYYNKDTSLLKEYVVVFSEKLHKVVKQKIHEHFKAIRLRKMPIRQFTAANKAPCMYCPFLSVCFSEVRAKVFEKSIQKRYEN